MSKVLGLDIGANSIGWALVDDESKNIIDMGVRVFPAGVNDYDTSKEKSKMTERREARSARRRIWRRRKRLARLLHIFREYNISKFGPAQFNDMEPYSLRKNALDNIITLDELARIIYHLSKRRGYFDISSAASGDEKAKKEKGDVLKGISELNNAIKEGGSRTLGEFFFSLNPEEIRIRNRWTERKMFQNEFNIIWKKQKEYYPDILTDELYNLIFYGDKGFNGAFSQRPLKSQKQLIGKCKFEPQYPRAPKSHPIAQLFRMYQVVNNLTISGGKRILPEHQELTEEERERLINYLLNHEKIELKDDNKTLANNLKIERGKKYVTNFDTAKKIHGVNTYCKIRKSLNGSTILDKKASDLNDDDFRYIWRIIFEETIMEKRITKLQKYCKLDYDIAAKLADISLEPGYASISIKAMRNMLPHLKNGMKYHEAALAAGYQHSFWDDEVEQMDYLPDPIQIRNPVVTTALQQVQKVVNELIEVSGKPDIVRIEMARDMKKTKMERDEIRNQNSANEKERDEARLEIKNYFSESERKDREFPRDTYILKYRLWKQQNEECVYSGKKFGIAQLFSAETDIDHILPYSRTLDDSFMNKVVCFRSENAFKANKIPWEAYKHVDGRYEAILERVKHFPYPKARKFKMNTVQFQEWLGKEGFISRQLNDTRYISREAKNYLKHICQNVNVATGTTTSYLRRLWGLNTILGKDGDNIKNREDHRHHAIDAVVIALTEQSALQRLSNYLGITGDHEFHGIDTDIALTKFPVPWDSFRNDVKFMSSNIIISHKVNKRARGKLHEDTYFGLRKNPDHSFRTDENGKKLYHTRKPLDLNLTYNQIHHIVEPDIRNALLTRLEQFGISSDEKISKLPEDFFKEPLVIYGKNCNFYSPKYVRIAVPSSTMRNIRGYNIWVETGGNHHVIIYKDIDSGKQKGKIVTLFDAVQRKKNGLPVVDTKLSPNEEFMYSLMRNELVFIGQLPGGFDFNIKKNYSNLFDKIFRIQIIEQTKLTITMRKHNVAVLVSKDREGKEIRPGVLRKIAPVLNATKLKISPAGYLSLADD